MGSKTPEAQRDKKSFNTTSPVASAGQPRGAQHATDGDGDLGADSDDGDGDDGKDLNTTAVADGQKKKKKKKKRKKCTNKKKATSPAAATKQTSPPTVPVAQLFPSGVFLPGEEVHPSENLARTTGEEKRYLSRQHMDPEFLNNYRHAAEVHRQVRAHVRTTTRPRTSLRDVADTIDNSVLALLDNAAPTPGSPKVSGLGFPTGLAVNNCAAHWTPNPGGRDIVLQASDTVKVDFGVHINGWIVDSAFTLSWDPVWDPLLAGVKAATDTGLGEAGVDARMSEIGAAIQEVMESYEVVQGTNTLPVKAISTITGHSINQFRIHGGKTIPFVRNNSTEKMEEGEVFAIETFGSTGRGRLVDDPDPHAGVYGYGLSSFAPARPNLPLASARKLHAEIKQNFGTLVFCRRYLERLGIEKYLLGLNSLVQNGVLDQYMPLVDQKGCQTAQFEHTVLLRNDGVKEVVSRGEDY